MIHMLDVWICLAPGSRVDIQTSTRVVFFFKPFLGLVLGLHNSTTYGEIKVKGMVLSSDNGI